MCSSHFARPSSGIIAPFAYAEWNGACDCSQFFRDGKQLADTVKALREKHLDPLSTEFLTIDVIRVRLRRRQGGSSRARQVYYTLDHQRLKCMQEAGCQKILARVVLQDPFFGRFGK